MRQFRKIFRFETVNLLTKKVYIGVTLFLLAVIVCVTFFPRVAALFEDDEEEQGGTADALLVALGLVRGGPAAGAVDLAFLAAAGLAILWAWEDG